MHLYCNANLSIFLLQFSVRPPSLLDERVYTIFVTIMSDRHRNQWKCRQRYGANEGAIGGNYATGTMKKRLSYQARQGRHG